MEFRVESGCKRYRSRWDIGSRIVQWKNSHELLVVSDHHAHQLRWMTWWRVLVIEIAGEKDVGEVCVVEGVLHSRQVILEVE